MIIPNPILKLDYDSAGHMLSVEWPGFRDYSVNEAVHILDIIIEAFSSTLAFL